MDAPMKRIINYLRCCGLEGDALIAATEEVRKQIAENASESSWITSARAIADSHRSGVHDVVPAPSPTRIAPQKLEMPWAPAADEMADSAQRLPSPVSRWMKRLIGDR